MPKEDNELQKRKLSIDYQAETFPDILSNKYKKEYRNFPWL